MTTKHISEYPQLLNAVLSCQKIVYLCGAGASMSLGDHGLGWGNWILAGKKYLLLPEQYELDRRIGICVNIAPRATTRGNSNGMYK